MKKIFFLILSVSLIFLTTACINHEKVTRVTLDRTGQITLYVGDSTVLQATVFPANAHTTEVFWQSMDRTVATVSSNGVVTAVGTWSGTSIERTTAIRVTAVCGGHQASITVRVIRP